MNRFTDGRCEVGIDSGDSFFRLNSSTRSLGCSFARAEKPRSREAGSTEPGDFCLIDVVVDVPNSENAESLKDFGGYGQTTNRALSFTRNLEGRNKDNCRGT